MGANLRYMFFAPEALNQDLQPMTETTTIAPRRPRPVAMTLTGEAAARVKALMASQGPEVLGLKIGVKKGGCAGMEYTMTWAKKIDRFDEVVEAGGARVIIEPEAVLYLLGTEMDFRSDKLTSGFVFNNPNQKGACGCGESVNLEPAASDEPDVL